MRIFVPRPFLKPEKARALYKRSLVSEALNRQEDSRIEQEESVQLYCEICHLSRANLEVLTERDFDDVVAFWSR